jgi:hypothetical protein
MSAERSEMLNEAGQALIWGLTGPRCRLFARDEAVHPDFLANAGNAAI